MRRLIVVSVAAVWLIPAVAAADSGADDAIWSEQERQWLKAQSSDAFQALMTHLESGAPLPAPKKEALRHRLQDWPPEVRVAPDTWIDKMIDGKKPELIQYARVLPLNDREIDDADLKRLLSRQAFKQVVSSGAIHQLRLSNNPIGNAGAKALAKSGLLRGVHKVYLANTDIGEAGTDALYRNVPSSCSKIEGLERPCREPKNKTFLGTVENSSDGMVEGFNDGAGEKSMAEAFKNAENTGESSGTSHDEKSKSDSKNDDEKAAGERSETSVVGNGQLNVKTIEKRLEDKAHDPARQCYEEYLRDTPKAAGKVVINFEIGRRGKVTKTNVIVNGVGGDVGSCVADVISQIRFPRPKGGSVVTKKTYVFTPDNNAPSDGSSEKKEEQQ